MCQIFNTCKWCVQWLVYSFFFYETSAVIFQCGDMRRGLGTPALGHIDSRGGFGRESWVSPPTVNSADLLVSSRCCLISRSLKLSKLFICWKPVHRTCLWIIRCQGNQNSEFSALSLRAKALCSFLPLDYPLLIPLTGLSPLLDFLGTLSL